MNVPKHLREGWEDEERLRRVVPLCVAEGINARYVNIKVLKELLDRLALAELVCVAAQHVKTFPNDPTVRAEMFRQLAEWAAEKDDHG